MLRLLKFLFTGSLHEHKWQVHERFNIVAPYSGSRYGVRYVLKCETCGNLKCKEIS